MNDKLCSTAHIQLVLSLAEPRGKPPGAATDSPLCTRLLMLTSYQGGEHPSPGSEATVLRTLRGRIRLRHRPTNGDSKRSSRSWAANFVVIRLFGSMPVHEHACCPVAFQAVRFVYSFNDHCAGGRIAMFRDVRQLQALSEAAAVPRCNMPEKNVAG